LGWAEIDLAWAYTANRSPIAFLHDVSDLKTHTILGRKQNVQLFFTSGSLEPKFKTGMVRLGIVFFETRI
jgi:hypothetical protein